MEDCVDEKTFYEKLESLKPGESKVTVYIADSFYENAKNYLQTLPKFQQGKEHESHAELSKRDISTIKRKGWTLKAGVPNEKNFKSDWISLPVIF